MSGLFNKVRYDRTCFTLDSFVFLLRDRDDYYQALHGEDQGALKFCIYGRVLAA